MKQWCMLIFLLLTLVLILTLVVALGQMLVQEEPMVGQVVQALALISFD